MLFNSFQGTFSLIIEAWNTETSGLESTGEAAATAVPLLRRQAATAALFPTVTHTHVCTAVLVRTLIDIMHFLAPNPNPYPNPKTKS